MDKHKHEAKHNVPTNTIDTDDDHTTEASYRSKPHNSDRKKLYAILSAIVLIVIVAIATGIYTYKASEDNAKKESTIIDSLAMATKFESPNALLDKIKPKLKGQSLIVAKSGGTGASTEEGYGIYNPPQYQVSGKPFKNFPAESFGLGYADNSSVAGDNYHALVHFFDTNKFKRILNEENRIGSISQTANATYIAYAEYESSNLLCAIWHADASETELQSHISSVGCADKASYKTASDGLTQFYTAYTKDNKQPNKDLVFGMIETGNGKDGYEYAVLHQVDDSIQIPENDTNYFEGLYYKAPTDKDWTYFAGASNGSMACTDYDTPALKVAFDGISCYDVNTKTASVVRA